MKLLVDQNLSSKLPLAIGDLFPGSAHVRDLGMSRASDALVWEYASQNGFVIATKDGWFYQRSLLVGHPPKVVWIRTGNCPAGRIEQLLRRNAIRIRQFADDEGRSCIALD